MEGFLVGGEGAEALSGVQAGCNLEKKCGRSWVADVRLGGTLSASYPTSMLR